MKIIIHDSNERNDSRKISNQIDKTMGKKRQGNMVDRVGFRKWDGSSA